MRLSSEDTELFGKSPGNTRGLNIRSPLYFGGANRAKMRLLEARVGVTGSFEGCITDVKVGGKRVELVGSGSSAVESADVVDCSVATTNMHNNRGVENGTKVGQPPCPCINDGKCVSANPTKCSCVNGYRGDLCEDEPSLCYLLKPCVNGGTCSDGEENYKCHCPWGYGGVDCQRQLEYDSSVGFRGDGHLRFRPPLEGDSELEIDLTISTEDDEGTLVMLTASNHSYFVAYIEEGRVKLELNYGINSTSPAVLLESTTLVADGKNRRVRTKISPDFISIRVDDGIVFTQAIPKPWIGPEALYIAGFDTRASEAEGRFFTWRLKGLRGCILDLVINGSQVNFKTDSISAANVVPCQVNEIFGPEVNFANLSMDDFDEDAYLERLNRIEG